MSTLGERIRFAREQKGLLQSDLAKLINVKSSGVISNWEKDLNKPDAEKIVRLCSVLDISASYLLDYYGKPNIEFSSSEINHINKYRDLDDHGRKLIDMILDAESERCLQPAAIVEFSSKTTPARHLLEYFRSASAGSGVFILGNEATSKIAVSEDDWHSNGDYVISVAGDSMIPVYKDGDKVIVSQRAEVLYGDIGIFVVNGNAYIKKYGENELISLNPEADNIKISEYDNIVCMGKVIGKIEGEYEIIND